MGSLILPELSLDRPFSRTIGKFLAEVSRICGVSEKISKLDDYVNRLQDEMNKIDAFKRELPLCMLLLNDAIVTMKNELMEYKKSDAEPVLEEFIPLKTSTDDEKVESIKENGIINSKDKMNWMNSVQLWNSGVSNNKQMLMADNCKKIVEEEIHPQVMDNLFQSNKKRIVGRSFVPYKECSDFPLKMLANEEGNESGEVMELSLSLPDIKNSREEVNSLGLSPKSSCSRSGSSCATNGRSNFKDGLQQTNRKQRRSWSPELHRRFVNALNQLGGAQAATPKQIREHMQVDGLTNDEVKSHLQKYRLHTRKVPPTTNSSNNIQPVVLGSLLMSKGQYGESLKQRNSLSNSPHGPLLLTGSSLGTSTTGRESTEDEDDEKSESHSWKSQLHLSRRDGV